MPTLCFRWNYRPQTPVMTGHEVSVPKGFDYTITLHPDVNTLGKCSYLLGLLFHLLEEKDATFFFAFDVVFSFQWQL